jgi:hypothetical protein
MRLVAEEVLAGALPGPPAEASETPAETPVADGRPAPASPAE